MVKLSEIFEGYKGTTLMDAGLLSAGATLAAPLVAKVFSSASSAAARTGAKVSGKIIEEFRLGSSDILLRSLEKCQHVKTLTCGDNPSKILDLYVNLNLKNGDREYTDLEVIDGLEHFRRVIVTGLGGAGKSMFMKFLTVCRFENSKGKIPIFIELRHLNSITNSNLMAYCFYSMKSASSGIKIENFESMVRSGVFLFIFDGFDEVDPALKDELERQILDFALEFPEAMMVISSRPDARLSSWTRFKIFHVCQLDISKATEVVNKIRFSPDIKKRFLKELPALWKTHESFLSIPLLSTIMLMTFGKFSEISPKFTLFYRLAFQTLFREHDAAKEQFKRKINSPLDLGQFEKVFSAFCALSYTESMYSFTEVQAVKL